MNSKDNPDDLNILIKILNLPQQIKIPRKCRTRAPRLYFELKKRQGEISRKRIEMLASYKVGKYKDWEGDGYFMSDIFLYKGIYYG